MFTQVFQRKPTSLTKQDLRISECGSVFGVSLLGDDEDMKEGMCSSLVNPVTNRQENCYHRVKQ